MNIKRIGAIFKKQVKDTLKNKAIFIQFLMLPLITIIMHNSINLNDMPQNFFVIMFSSMFVGMIPLTSMASIISEEKEKNTLRTLMMANVKPMEYLIGVGSYIVIMCLIGLVIFALVGEYKGLELIQFIGILFTGVITSGIIGAAIGITSKSEMNATAISFPFMILFSFVPMISTFNSSLKKTAFFLYSQQINNLINQTVQAEKIWKSFSIIGINILIAILFFCTIYKKRGLIDS